MARLGKTYMFTFGKYKGRLLQEILQEDPTYLYWAHNNVDNFTLKTKILNEVEEIAHEEDSYNKLDWGDFQT